MSVPSSCAHRSLDTWPCHLMTRHWRAKSCGCHRHTSKKKGKIAVKSASSFPMNLGSNDTSPQLMHLPVIWNMAVPPDDTTLAYKCLRMSTSHSVRKEMTWIPLAPFPVNLAGPTVSIFGANSDDVSVWELARLLLGGRLELCVVVHTNVAQFLGDVPSSLPLCGCSERVPSVSEVLHEILCKITASHVRDGVMQSATFVDTVCDTSVVRPATHRTVWVAMYMADTLNVSNLVCVKRSRIAFVFRGASVSKTGLSSGATLRSFAECVMPDFLHVVPQNPNTDAPWRRVSASQRT